MALPDSGQRLGPSSVLEGREGYLYENFYGVPEYVTGAANFSPALVQRWVSLIETRHAWCKQRGARYFLMLAPDKHVVYADMLPAGFTVSPGRAMIQLLAALTPEIRDCVIYPAAGLIAGRDTHPTYFRSDAHWTHHGAWLAYIRLRRSLWPDEPVPDEKFEERTYRRVGDLGVRLEPPRYDTATDLISRVANRPRHSLVKFAFNLGQVELFERDIPNGPRGVIFRDSGGAFLLPFLANDFSRLVAVATDSMFYDLLRSERPDIVISQITEHNICAPATADPERLQFPDDLPPYDFTSFTGVALPLVLHTPRAADTRAIADLDYAAQHEPGWSDGVCTEIVLRCRIPHEPCELELTLSGFTHPPAVSSQHVDVVVNSHLVGSFDIGAEPETVRCAVPLACLFSGRTVRVELFHPECVVPADIGAGEDQREIAIRLHRLVLRAAT